MSKILIVDDSATIRAALATAVRSMKYEPVMAETGEEAVELFAAERPSLILLDVKMPGIDGYETARRIRAAQPEDWTPIIFLSAGDYDQDLERAIECGGDDYLMKPVSAVVLSAKIRALQRLDDMRRRQIELSVGLTAANRQLETLANQDGLTGIANRRSFDFLMERHFAQAMRQHTLLSVVLCDVDHFKAYNDNYGHLAGDACLRQIGSAQEMLTSASPLSRNFSTWKLASGHTAGQSSVRKVEAGSPSVLNRLGSAILSKAKRTATGSGTRSLYTTILYTSSTASAR